MPIIEMKCIRERDAWVMGTKHRWIRRISCPASQHGGRGGVATVYSNLLTIFIGKREESNLKVPAWRMLELLISLLFIPIAYRHQISLPVPAKSIITTCQITQIPPKATYMASGVGVEFSDNPILYKVCRRHLGSLTPLNPLLQNPPFHLALHSKPGPRMCVCDM